MTDWQASDYYEQSSLQEAMAKEQLDRLRLTGTERILDVGCGDGKITAQIAARITGGSVLGVDPSASMVAFASSHFGPPTQPNIRFELADARRLTYHQEFDLVVSFNALHWVPEQAEALRSIHAALKPEGRAQLRLVCNGPRKSLEDVIEEVRAEPHWKPMFSGFRKPYIHINSEDYRSMAETAGFRVVQLHVDDKAWDFKSRDRFFAFCRATFAEWTQHIPEHNWPEFITEVLDRYRSVAGQNPQEANTFKFYQMEVVLISQSS